MDLNRFLNFVRYSNNLETPPNGIDVNRWRAMVKHYNTIGFDWLVFCQKVER